MKPYVIGFYGESNSGKTMLITEVIKSLSEEGFNVASVKISDKQIGIDAEGKDTWKHAKAGSKLVVFSTGRETDVIIKQKMSYKEINNFINYVGKYDVVIVEGANDKVTPKVRLGNISERENTIMTYNNEFEKLITLIKSHIRRN